MDRLTKLYAKMTDLLEKSEKATEAEDLELANELMAEFKTVKGQYDTEVELEAQRKELAAVKSAYTERNRLPFNTDEKEDDTDEEEETISSRASKSIANIRYGSNAGVKGVLDAVYETDYSTLRHQKNKVFEKWVRTGSAKMNANAERLLDTLVLLPKHVQDHIDDGMDLADIKATKATLQEASQELGGVLSPEDFREQMIMRRRRSIRISSLARHVSTSREVVEWPVLLGGDGNYRSAVRVTWVDEVPADANVAETNPTFGMKRIQAYTVMARTDVSKNNLEDSVFDIIGLLSDLMGEGFDVDMDQRLITGQGGNSLKGILQNRDGSTATPATGIGVENLGHASLLNSGDGVIDLQYALDAQYREGAVFLGNKLTHKAVRKLKDGNGNYIWERSFKAGEPAVLLGNSFIENESLPAIAADSHPLIYGDPTGLVVVDRVGMTIERVEDTTTAGRNKVAFFARKRTGSDVAEPWKFKAGKIAA